MSRFLKKTFRPRLSATLLLTAAIAAVVLLWPARRLRGENFVFYFPNQHKVIPLQTVGNVQYLPLIPLLNLRGEIGGLEEKSNSLKVWVGGEQLQFHLNQRKVQINKTTVLLAAPVLRVQGEWIAPESFLTSVFGRLPGPSVVYRPGASRAFLGGVQPITYTVHLAAQPSGASLTFQFTGKVSAETASRNGKWVIFLQNASIEPMEQIVKFQNPYLTDVRFDDQDGRPKLIITPKVAGLDFYPVLSHDQQTLVADFRAPGTTAKVQTAPGPARASAAAAGPATSGKTATNTTGAATSSAAAPPPPPPPLPVIVLDAGHGGSDSGARSRDGVLEKNLAAGLVARVSSALQAAHQFRVVLTRPGDSDPTFEERTLTANTARPAVFLTFHAGEMGNSQPVIRVYTYQPSGPETASGAVPGPSLFVPWELAQRPQMSRSQQLAADLHAKFAAISGASAPATMPAPVRQLRSIASPAVAIEMGTLSPAMNAGVLNQPAFQQQVANAAVAAVEQFIGGAAKP